MDKQKKDHNKNNNESANKKTKKQKNIDSQATNSSKKNVSKDENNTKKDKKMKFSKKNIILSFITFALLILFYILIFNQIKSITQKANFEKSILNFAQKNNEIVFSIPKIVFFSSSDSKNKTSTSTNFTIENLYAYTDIALFINRKSNENSLKNTLKELSIENIKFTTMPTEGTPKLYYKNLNQFASSTLPETSPIENNLNFAITSEDTADLSVPILYNNCANPITLSYINENIRPDYTITDTSIPITYNGSLLKRCGVLLSNISCSISFDILITNNQDEKFKSSVYLNIPYEDEGKSIYDGNLIVEKATDFIFYRYE